MGMGRTVDGGYMLPLYMDRVGLVILASTIVVCSHFFNFYLSF